MRRSYCVHKDCGGEIKNHVCQKCFKSVDHNEIQRKEETGGGNEYIYPQDDGKKVADPAACISGYNTDY